MNENKNTLPCAVVRDILPLYHDEVVSAETRSAVGEHLMGCAACRAQYEAMEKELAKPVKGGQSTLGRFRDMLKKQKRKKIAAVVLAAVVAAAAAVGGVAALSNCCIVPVKDSQWEVKQVCRVDTDQGPQIFIHYVDTYGGKTATHMETVEKDGKTTFAFQMRHPVLSWQQPGGHMERPCLYFVADETVGGVDEVTFNGVTVWTAEENDAPGYVDAFWDWEKAMWEDGGGSYAGYDFTDDHVYILWPDGHGEYWTYDGELYLQEPAESDLEEMGEGRPIEEPVEE